MQRLWLLTLLFAGAAAAQLQSNASLNGAYYVRYLGVNTDPTDSPLSFSGTITFDGNGRFTVAGSGYTAARTDHVLQFQTSGTYTVQSSGMFRMSNPFDANPDPQVPTDLYGGVGVGAIVASSTDTFYCDLFIAIPVSTSASLGTLSGTYRVASMEFLNGDFDLTRDAFFSMSANGSGSLGDVTVNGTAINLQHAATTQTSTGATYTLAANGTGTLVLPAPSGVAANNVLISGTKVLYVSPDGNFFIAGGANAYDLVMGVKSPPAATSMNGIYFTGLLQNIPGDAIYSGGGSANEVASLKTEIGHQRINPDGFANFDYTYALKFEFDADATARYSESLWAMGPGGNLVVGSGNGNNYQLMLYLKAPAMSGSGVFLNPQGIVNAASNAPFTAQVSPGEVVTLYGTNLAPGVFQASAPFPTELGGVKVTINATAVPVYSVTPTQISLVVPFNSPANGSLLTVQVNNNGTLSNEGRVYSGNVSPGIFTVPPGGLGNGAILHADYSLVSTASPAVGGETVQMFLTGLGTVNSNVAAGAPAPSAPPFAEVTNKVEIFIGGASARVTYAGLAPGLGGLYQLNVTIPAGLETGNQDIYIWGVDGDTSHATIPVRAQ